MTTQTSHQGNITILSKMAMGHQILAGLGYDKLYPHHYFVETGPNRCTYMISAFEGYEPGMTIRAEYDIYQRSYIVDKSDADSQRFSLIERIMTAPKSRVDGDVIISVHSYLRTGTGKNMISGFIRDMTPDVIIPEWLKQNFRINAEIKVVTATPEDEVLSYLNHKHRNMIFNELSKVAPGVSGLTAIDPRPADEIPGTRAYADRLHKITIAMCR